MSLAKILRSAAIVLWGLTISPQLYARDLNRSPVAWFMDQPPTDIANSLPKGAQDVVVAKIRLIQPAAWLGGRHCEGCTNDIFGTRLKIIEVRSGRGEIDNEVYALFGLRSENRASDVIRVPVTPAQQSREYFVVSYLDVDGRRRLVPFEISKLELEEHYAEVFAYDSSRRENRR
jgi:hypothetical protein